MVWSWNYITKGMAHPELMAFCVDTKYESHYVRALGGNFGLFMRKKNAASDLDENVIPSTPDASCLMTT